LGAFQRSGVQLAISSTGQMLDLRSSVGDLMSTLGAFFAAEANRKHRERILRGKNEAIRRGRKPAGPTPFGYVSDRETAVWSIDAELGAVVVEIFTRVSEGETCEAISGAAGFREPQLLMRFTRKMSTVAGPASTAGATAAAAHPDEAGQ